MSFECNGNCPVCGEPIDIFHDPTVCHNCGQGLCWEEDDLV